MILSSYLQSFVDDTQLIHYIADIMCTSFRLNRELELVCKFSNHHNLNINSQKMIIILFCADNKRAHIQSKFNINVKTDLLQTESSNN